jgi:ribosomal protein S18 acetylase RimI-like enzyme
MKVSDLFEAVNQAQFKPGFSKEKAILDGKYKLVATNGYLKINSKQSDQFRIEVQTARGTKLGWVNFENKDGHLEALDLFVDKNFRRRGLATEMYKFARELGNDIRPSSKQLGNGKDFWKKDHSKD